MQESINISCPNNHGKQVQMICFNNDCQEYRLACILCLKNSLHQDHLGDLEEWSQAKEVIKQKSEKFINFQNQLDDCMKNLQVQYSQFIKKIDQIHKNTIKNLTLNDELFSKQPKIISDYFFRLANINKQEDEFFKCFKKKLEKFISFLDELYEDLNGYQQKSIIAFQKQQQIINKKQLDRLVFKIKVESQNLNNINQTTKSELNLFCSECDMAQINTLKKYLFKLKPNLDEWIIQTNLFKSFSVPYPGQFCCVCQKSIKEEPKQYYSPFIQKHVCESCAEYQIYPKYFYPRYKYQDLLIFINGPLKNKSMLNNISERFIGQGSKFDIYQEYICNGCKTNSPNGTRYIAVNIEKIFMINNKSFSSLIDYCSRCFQILKEKGSWQAQEIINKDKELGMTEDTLLVRILQNEYGEFTF